MEQALSKFNANQILGKVVSFGNKVIGAESRSLKNQAEVLRAAKNLGKLGVPQSTITKAQRIAKVASGRTIQARVKTGLGIGVGIGTGVAAVKKYNTSQDNKILKRIDKMYEID